ncbi:hypothetical protein [Streptomyces sp. NPDC006784]|uniref:hypothetical protein n=1 Tax=Streptomyces sp. NPDC006784 TaxID=3364764 RepID=UPI003695FBB3
MTSMAHQAGSASPLGKARLSAERIATAPLADLLAEVSATTVLVTGLTDTVAFASAIPQPDGMVIALSSNADADEADRLTRQVIAHQHGHETATDAHVYAVPLRSAA